MAKFYFYDENILSQVRTYSVERREQDGPADTWVAITPRRRRGLLTKVTMPGEYRVSGWDINGVRVVFSDVHHLKPGNVVKIKGVDVVYE